MSTCTTQLKEYILSLTSPQSCDKWDRYERSFTFLPVNLDIEEGDYISLNGSVYDVMVPGIYAALVEKFKEIDEEKIRKVKESQIDEEKNKSLLNYLKENCACL